MHYVEPKSSNQLTANTPRQQNLVVAHFLHLQRTSPRTKQTSHEAPAREHPPNLRRLSRSHEWRSCAAEPRGRNARGTLESCSHTFGFAPSIRAQRAKTKRSSTNFTHNVSNNSREAVNTYPFQQLDPSLTLTPPQVHRLFRMVRSM